MKFTVGRDALGEAVAFVSRALPSRPVVPLLSGLLIEAGPDGVVLSCFDYEISARARMDAEVSEPGAALVPGRLLAEITRSLPARPAEFARDGEAVRLTCGRAEFELICLPDEEYPALPASPPVVGVADGGALAVAIGQVAPAASKDDTLPMLTAVCLDVAGPVLTLAATDRYRLAAREVPFAPAEPGVTGIALAPARFMVDGGRMLAAGKPVTLAFGAQSGANGSAEGPRPAEGLISLETVDRRLTARLVGGEFIRYRSRFPDEFGSWAEIPAEPLIEAVRRAALVAERAGPVRLSFGQGRVTIEAHDEGRARAAETVPAEFSGDQPVISFNPHYLLDGLTAAAAEEGPAPRSPAGTGNEGGDAESGPEPGKIRLEFTSPAKPALVSWAGADRGDGAGAESGRRIPAFRYLVVPLRVPVR